MIQSTFKSLSYMSNSRNEEKKNYVQSLNFYFCIVEKVSLSIHSLNFSALTISRTKFAFDFVCSYAHLTYANLIVRFVFVFYGCFAPINDNHNRYCGHLNCWIY